MLYLIRHAHALSDEEDRLRPLSAKGWMQVRELCQALKHGRFTPAEIWHSPLVRARETAALVAAGLGLPSPVIQVQGLLPEDDPRRIAKRLAEDGRDLAVVGHEPHLGVLAAILVHGVHGGPPFAFAKAGALALRPAGELWSPEWMYRGP